MATAINTATVTTTEAPYAITRRAGHSQANGSDTTLKTAITRTSGAQKKYRHVAAVHSRPRTSCLSHDSPTTPSFIGFRNLMVIVLSESIMSLILFHLGFLDLVLTKDSRWEPSIDDRKLQ
jgi:diacylglycerol O-acyltransferase 1